MSSPTKETTPSQTSPSPRTPDDVRVPVPRPGSPASPITKSPPPPIGTDSTPSNASETTAHSEGDAWDLGLSLEALQQATNINHGLQLRFSVWIPTRPNAWTRGAILPALQTEGNEIVGPANGLYWNASQLNLSWHHFQNYAINHFNSENSAVGSQIRIYGGTSAVKWYGIIPTHPDYELGENVIINSDVSWRQFAQAVANAGQHEKESHLLCMAARPDLALHDEMARIIHHRMQANQSPRPNAHINAAVTPNLGVPVEQADHSSSPNHRSPSPNQVVPVAQANHSASPDVEILVGVRPPNNMPNGRVFSPDITVVTTRRFANRRHNQRELPDIIHIPLIDLTLPPYCCSLSLELQPISP
ncbi:hypothetical protein PCASD_00032 [Puccinia coronata f. sp. avenae]|uniref:Uncharacterized protein n=1 Tax=Puccinia coronata f. sp. avenae TaxID=200324 RepID=A0A2N5VQI6_9BASI|nr:hypothetical protein PCASD_00032 [Puccinia coronata f. sp. avenae]